MHFKHINSILKALLMSVGSFTDVSFSVPS